MILTRLGNKRRMSKELISHFPEHRMRIELFFGAGGSFFYLPKAKYTIVNDLDDDVTNLYMVVQNHLNEFREQIRIVPLTESLMKHWRINKEIDPIKKALRFIFLSNFSYMGKGDTLRLGLDNAKQSVLKNLDKTFLLLQDVKIMNRDFREVLPAISFSKGLNDREKCFVYLDPIYHDTEHYYSVPKWSEKDSIDCLDLMVDCGIRSAMSEFDSDFIIEEAQARNLNIIPLKSRANIKNRRTEILITNYNSQQLFTV
ncbi:DNA adenine methylase [Chryseobacterium carnipullorum]|uniref:DNA adenine methylase n=1 Tax=Chryseobacterium carnipullorum TaxID=1124835 RepID=A0A376DTV2_CHRCU|nr:DNA adenine methylase [Chryseobacterium carnipullorum]AZA49554.1 DNA adenine methylase [Chryseobacterium carnipullorum]AZA64451.1 DNA adenine methylase [Chryseobacterium carnipullorum]STC94804.1 DNA adenine methylase [Chryseobacterium carnipullorum]